MKYFKLNNEAFLVANKKDRILLYLPQKVEEHQNKAFDFYQSYESIIGEPNYYLIANFYFGWKPKDETRFTEMFFSKLFDDVLKAV